MEANKLECEKCIKIAKVALIDGNTDKAIRFLRKSLQLYPSDLAKSLLENLLKQQSNDGDDDAVPNDTSSTSEPTRSPSPHRNKRPANTENTNNSSSASNKPANESYSPDQLDAVKRIKNCKDFYEILGVPKSASEADLKRQYKKLALQFHPDKNKAPGATEAFKAIGKAFAILTDTQKRKHYDMHGPDSFESNASTTSRRSNVYRTNATYGNNYWNDDEFSAEEIFNMFFGAGFGNNAAAHRHHARQQSQQTNFVFTQSNNYAVLFQLMPIIMIVVLSLLSSIMVGEPSYTLHKTNKYTVKRITQDHKVPYFVKNDFKVDNSNELYRMERQVEEDLLMELRQSCYREKNYKDTAIWRARNYGDERLIKKAYEMDTPSCDKINSIFNAG